MVLVPVHATGGHAMLPGLNVTGMPPYRTAHMCIVLSLPFCLCSEESIDAVQASHLSQCIVQIQFGATQAFRVEQQHYRLLKHKYPIN